MHGTTGGVCGGGKTAFTGSFQEFDTDMAAQETAVTKQKKRLITALDAMREHQVLFLGRKLQKSEREKPHSGKTKSQSPTKTPCNQPAIFSGEVLHTVVAPKSRRHRLLDGG